MIPLFPPRIAALTLASFAVLLPGGSGLFRSSLPDLRYENRNPASWPNEVLSLSGRLQGYQEFFGDRLGWRSHFVALRNRIYDYLGRSPNPLARSGRDGWLLTTADSALLDRAGLVRFDDDTIRRFRAQMAARVSFWHGRKIEYYLLLGPEKSSVYPEQLDALFPIGETAFDRTYRVYGSDVFGPRFVDPRYALRNDKSQRTYFEADSHWNVFGARIAYRQLMKTIASDFPHLAAVPDGSYAVRWKPHKGDLVPHGLEASYTEQAPYVVSDAGSCGAQRTLNRLDWPNFHHHFESSVASCAGRRLTALVVHDSFGLALQPFLARTFARTLFAAMPVEGDIPGELIDDAMKIVGPIDTIIQVRVERAFMRGRME